MNTEVEMHVHPCAPKKLKAQGFTNVDGDIYSRPYTRKETVTHTRGTMELRKGEQRGQGFLEDRNMRRGTYGSVSTLEKLSGGDSGLGNRDGGGEYGGI
jgi:hypothetical protein